MASDPPPSYTRGFATKRFAVARAADVSDHLPLWATLVGAPTSTPSPARAAPPRNIAASH